MSRPADYLDLYDYRLRVAAMYRERNESLRHGADPVEICRRFRQRRDELFAGHPQSALGEDQRRAFDGLPYFPYNRAARVEAEIDTDVEPRRLEVGTSGPESMPMELVATLRFSLDGENLSLALYWIDVYGGGLFLPFRDATAPEETYGGGRYLFDTVKGSDFLTTPDGRPVLDFNYAYNPSCAYDHRWVCPLAPPENRLAVPIRAGERKPASPHVA